MDSTFLLTSRSHKSKMLSKSMVVEESLLATLMMDSFFGAIVKQ